MSGQGVDFDLWNPNHIWVRVNGNRHPSTAHDARDYLNNDWMPLSWAFKGDVSEWVKMVWPNLYCHRTRTNNKPTRADPLGAEPAIKLVWQSDEQTAGIIVFGEASPLLEPGTLKNYILIQWPELFRTFENGTQT